MSSEYNPESLCYGDIPEIVLAHKSVREFSSKWEQEEWFKEMKWQHNHDGKSRIQSYIERG